MVLLALEQGRVMVAYALSLVEDYTPPQSLTSGKDQRTARQKVLVQVLHCLWVWSPLVWGEP